MKLKHKMIRDKIVEHFTDGNFTTDEAMRIVKRHKQCPTHTGLAMLLVRDSRIEKVPSGKMMEWRVIEGLI